MWPEPRGPAEGDRSSRASLLSPGAPALPRGERCLASPRAETWAEGAGSGGGTLRRAPCRLAALPRRGPHPAGGYDPAPTFGGEGGGGGEAGEALCSAAPAALRSSAPGSLPERAPSPSGQGRAGGRGTQGLTAPRPGGALKEHGLADAFQASMSTVLN